jgi:integrase
MRSGLYRRKAGGVWYAEFYDSHGNRRRESTKCRDRKAAEAAARDLERKAHDRTYRAAHAPPVTIAAALDHLINDRADEVAAPTREMFRQKGGHLVRLLGAVDVNQLEGTGAILGYTRTRLDEGAARETVRKELVTLRRALEAYRDDEQTITVDVRALFPKFKTKYVPRSRWLTPGEFLALLSVLPKHRQLWVTVAVYAGPRDSEIDGLEWAHVDFAGQVIHVEGTKTEGSDRPVPLHPVLAKVLARSQRPSGYVVGEWLNVNRDLRAACLRAPCPACRPVRREVMPNRAQTEQTRSVVHAVVLAADMKGAPLAAAGGACIACNGTGKGIARVTPNDLRRTLASWLKQEGIDSGVVAKILGNSARMVDLVYGQIDAATKARAMARLAGGEGLAAGCAAGVSTSGPSVSAVSPVSLAEVAEILTAPVPQTGIEPVTRGFSVRAPESAKLAKGKGKDRPARMVLKVV